MGVMQTLLFIIFVLLSWSAFAAIGGAYTCQVTDGVFENYNKEMSVICIVRCTHSLHSHKVASQTSIGKALVSA